MRNEYPGNICSMMCWQALGWEKVEPHEMGADPSTDPGAGAFHSPAAPQEARMTVLAHKPCLGL